MHERSRKNLQQILRGLSAIGHVKAAEITGLSEGTISKMQARKGENGNPDIKNNFPALADLLAAMNLKVVPDHWQCVDPETFNMIWTGHKKYMELIKSPDQLLFEDPE